MEIEEEPINIVELPAKKEFFALSFSIFGVEPEISTTSFSSYPIESTKYCLILENPLCFHLVFIPPFE